VTRENEAPQVLRHADSVLYSLQRWKNHRDDSSDGAARGRWLLALGVLPGAAGVHAETLLFFSSGVFIKYLGF
jgi:hypothetical protein